MLCAVEINKSEVAGTLQLFILPKQKTLTMSALPETFKSANPVGVRAKAGDAEGPAFYAIAHTSLSWPLASVYSCHRSDEPPPPASIRTEGTLHENINSTAVFDNTEILKSKMVIIRVRCDKIERDVEGTFLNVCQAC